MITAVVAMKPSGPMEPRDLLLGIGFFVVLAGFVLSLVGGVLYDPPIQRYLENFGVAPAPFFSSLSSLDDYLNARKLAKRWGHRPEFLRRWERLQITAMALVAVGMLLVAVAELVAR